MAVPQLPTVEFDVGTDSEKRDRAVTTGSKSLTIQLRSRADQISVQGARVIAFTDFSRKAGAEGRSNADGKVRLALGRRPVQVERLYIFPAANYWSTYARRVRLEHGKIFTLSPLDLTWVDGLRHFYQAVPPEEQDVFKVAVIDTGVDRTHPDLYLRGGNNLVLGEDPNDFGDNGTRHGTHVAGIIAARGKPPTGLHGLTPHVSLYSYRVFGKKKERAANFAIIKALYAAARQGCDVINLSLGGGPPDPALQVALFDAHQAGCLIVAAAGNDHHGPVNFPASDPLAIAVSAIGRKGTFPRGTLEMTYVARPYGKDRKNFLAAFSNIGPQITLTGPGVGIVSTVPGGYAAMSGTSMACPTVTACAARLLANHPDLRKMKRSTARVEDLRRLLCERAQSLGFTRDVEGHGLPPAH
jgi:subtilisin